MRKITLHIHITEHDNGARFYEWDMRGVEREESQRMLKEIGEDLKHGPMVVLKAEKGEKMRDIGEVIEKMVREIPKDEDNSWLISKLQAVARRARVTPQESIQSLWNEVANVLERKLGDPDEEWKRRIASIFAGRNSI